MSQYYKAYVSKAGCPIVFSPSDYDNPGKLMEHSYFGNDFVNAVFTLIENNPANVAWVGDYSEETAPLSVYHACWEESNNEVTNYPYKDFFKEIPEGFLLNHTKQEYVDMRGTKPDKHGLIINPLPLLTAIGNGMGGGDYHGSSEALVGTWAMCRIEFRHELPLNLNFKRIEPKFKEGRQ